MIGRRRCCVGAAPRPPGSREQADDATAAALELVGGCGGDQRVNLTGEQQVVERLLGIAVSDTPGGRATAPPSRAARLVSG